MRTDVFPEEDSVPVAWDEAEEGWVVWDEYAHERFQNSPHGYLAGGRACSELPLHRNFGGEIELEYCYSDGLRTDLPLFTSQKRSEAYFAGLNGDSSPWPNAYTYAYNLGRDEAQLIDWQK